ncbi:hypothetical protein V3C99_002694 [Haemonchus contortus]
MKRITRAFFILSDLDKRGMFHTSGPEWCQRKPTCYQPNSHRGQSYGLKVLKNDGCGLDSIFSDLFRSIRIFGKRQRVQCFVQY